jgi:hypothetical protein
MRMMSPRGTNGHSPEDSIEMGEGVEGVAAVPEKKAEAEKMDVGMTEDDIPF